MISSFMDYSSFLSRKENELNVEQTTANHSVCDTKLDEQRRSRTTPTPVSPSTHNQVYNVTHDPCKGRAECSTVVVCMYLNWLFAIE